MAEYIILKQFQPIDNMIKVDSIETVELFNNHYSIFYRNEKGETRQQRVMKNPFITQQLIQFNIPVRGA